MTSNINWPAPKAVTTSRPRSYGASVWSWHHRQSATSWSRSKSDPPCERLTTWWTSRRRRTPQAWQRQPARASTFARMAFHSAKLAAGRPLARGPPALISRRAFSPIGDRLSMPALRDFAHVGKILGPGPRKRPLLDYGRRTAGRPHEPPTRPSTRDSPRGRLPPGEASPPPWRRARRIARRAPSLRCPASRPARCVETARREDSAPSLGEGPP